MHILLFFPFYFLFPYFVPHTKPQNAHLWMVHKKLITFFLIYFGLYSCFYTLILSHIHVVEIADSLQHIPSNFHSRPLLLGSSCLTSQLHVQPGGATTVNSNTRSVNGGDTTSSWRHTNFHALLIMFSFSTRWIRNELELWSCCGCSLANYKCVLMWMILMMMVSDNNS